MLARVDNGVGNVREYIHLMRCYEGVNAGQGGVGETAPSARAQLV